MGERAEGQGELHWTVFLEENNQAHHGVLWTQESFACEYDSTRMDFLMKIQKRPNSEEAPSS